MKRKSLRTSVLLLGLLFVTCSSAYADTISFTSVTLTNIQLVSSAGTIVFSPTQLGSPTSASGAVANSFGEEEADQAEHPTLAQAAAAVNIANASGTANLTNLSLSATTSALPFDCVCSSEAEGLAILRVGFMVVGGSGNVDVTLSALLQSIQNLDTDASSLFAASDARVTLQVFGVQSFSFDSNVAVGPNDPRFLERLIQISEVLTLQFNQQYNLIVFVGANSRAGQNEIPEPATVVLLVSGLGFMAGFVRKRRTQHR